MPADDDPVVFLCRQLHAGLLQKKQFSRKTLKTSTGLEFDIADALVNSITADRDTPLCRRSLVSGNFPFFRILRKGMYYTFVQEKTPELAVKASRQ